MDLINDLTITTCLYYDLFGTEFGGRHGPKYKYFYGLLSMLKMDCPVVLYCWEKDIEETEKEITKFILKPLTCIKVLFMKKSKVSKT